MVEIRLRRPRQGRDLARRRGILLRLLRIALTLRLDMQPAQAQQARIVALGHFLKSRLGLPCLARELGGLRPKEQRQGLVAEQLMRLDSGFAGELRISGANRDHPPRQRGVALFVPLAARRDGHQGRVF